MSITNIFNLQCYSINMRLDINDFKCILIMMNNYLFYFEASTSFRDENVFKKDFSRLYLSIPPPL